MSKEKTVTSYKALDVNFQCRGYQYEVGKTYTHTGTIALCEGGFHACDNPMDVLDFYKLIDDDGKLIRFAEVTQFGEMKNDEKKRVSASITIKAELTLPDWIKASIDYITKAAGEKNGRDDSNLAASGGGSNLAASGDDSKLAASGYGSKLAASGGGSNVIVSAERDIAVKGSANTLICLTHYKDGKPVKFSTAKVGENGIKADTWYCLDGDGNFKEAA
jgi:hypothetical protein